MTATATAAYNFTLSVSTSITGTYYEIPATSGSLERSSEVIDVTDTTNAGYHARILGLLDASVSSEAFWAATDNALDAIEAAYEGRSDLWVKVLPDGIVGNGKKMPVVVESYSIPLDLGAAITQSISFQSNGPLVADDAT